jgi:hypothetical protein
MKGASFQRLDIQFEELLGVDLGGGCGHQVVGSLRLWKCNHVPDRFGFGGQHGDAVHAKCDAAVGRRAVGERVEQEAEFLAGFFVTEADNLEDLFLNLGVV